LVLKGTLFSFGSNQADICWRSLKLLPDKLCLVFKVHNSIMKRSTSVRHPLPLIYIFFSWFFSPSRSLLTPLHYKSKVPLWYGATTGSGNHHHQVCHNYYHHHYHHQWPLVDTIIIKSTNTIIIVLILNKITISIKQSIKLDSSMISWNGFLDGGCAFSPWNIQIM